MIIEVLLLSIIYTKLKGGKLNRLEDVNIINIFFIMAFLIYFISRILLFNDIKYGPFLYILSHIFILIAIYKNLNLKGFKILFIGYILNFLPILFNKGKMPISLNALKNLGVFKDQISSPIYIIMSDITKFNFLSDIIALKYILPKVISIGDIFISLGIFYFITTMTRE